jgi:uncharacterized protein YjbI with pentapeptide repeats
MTSTFLGKWRLHPTNISDGYAAYKPQGGQKPHTEDVLCLWFVHSGGFPYPPDKETNIGFILRADSKLCFLMNNGKYLGFGTGFVDTLAEATGFAFPGHDFRNLPAQFTSRIQSLHDDRFLYQLLGLLLSGVVEQFGLQFLISQVTPPLASVEASGKGDGVDFAWLDLSGVKLAKCSLKKAHLNDCLMADTDFSGSNLSGANLNHVDLTAVVANPIPDLYIKPLQPPSPDNPRTTFFGSKLKQSFIGNDWSMLDLTGATILDLSSPLSSEDNPLQVRQSILTNLNQNSLGDLSLQHAVFDNSVLDNVNLNGADLTHASFIQSSMHGAVLSNAKLKNANMTGAQLGSLGHLFTLPAGYEAHLKSGRADNALRNQFARHGITLSESTTINTLEPGRVWQLNDADNKISYTVRFEGDSTQVLTVYKPANPASLVNAYMPDAILTGANLFGITANDIQFYGSNARLDGSAILEDAKFNNSNLSTLNFTQAQMRGANLSNCHLFNAKFNKANLTPSASGSVADLSEANLQGADFTGAQLYGAVLTNAAVAINVPTKVIPKQGGVYLFSLPYNGDTATLDQYTTELSAAAASFFSFNPDGDEVALQQYLTALKDNNLTPLKIAFLKKRITLSAAAKIHVVETDGIWQIVDGAKSYTLWIGTDERSQTELYAAPSLTITEAGFKKRNLTLRWQASALIDAPGQQWLLDNDSENPKNSSTGYMKFIVNLNGKVLDVYGTAVRILRLGDHDQEQFVTETCQVTTLSQTNMSADTVCPNGATLSVNQAKSGKSWDTLWLRAATPPRPPDCVPTNTHWCPPPTRKKD